MTGTVKQYNNQRGFGFITAEDGNTYFAHINDVSDIKVEELKRGDFVSFDLYEGKKGIQAVKIQVLPKPALEPERERSRW
jgi:cold shock protein